MNLYTHKDANIRKTWLLFIVFFGIVIGFGYLLSAYSGNPVILWIAAGLSIVTSIIGYWKSDTIALAMAQAKPVSRRDAPELHMIVENLSIAAGLPTPRIHIVHDPSPNAFATGRDPEHSAIAVTTGLLDRLEKPELEGVIAHELSHIGNRDMLVSTVAVVLVGFISIAADFFMRSLWWGGGRRDDNRGGNAIFAIFAIVGAILLPIAATLMQLAISRRREFLADASGALLTRYPEGLARALEKIHADPHKLDSASHATAHLWFSNPFKEGGVAKLFMTHPPIKERIRVLRGI